MWNTNGSQKVMVQSGTFHFFLQRSRVCLLRDHRPTVAQGSEAEPHSQTCRVTRALPTGCLSRHPGDPTCHGTLGFDYHDDKLPASATRWLRLLLCFPAFPQHTPQPRFSPALFLLLRWQTRHLYHSKEPNLPGSPGLL
jgi:hypothetical protein